MKKGKSSIKVEEAEKLLKRGLPNSYFKLKKIDEDGQCRLIEITTDALELNNDLKKCLASKILENYESARWNIYTDIANFGGLEQPDHQQVLKLTIRGDIKEKDLEQAINVLNKAKEKLEKCLQKVKEDETREGKKKGAEKDKKIQQDVEKYLQLVGD